MTCVIFLGPLLETSRGGFLLGSLILIYFLDRPRDCKKTSFSKFPKGRKIFAQFHISHVFSNSKSQRFWNFIIFLSGIEVFQEKVRHLWRFVLSRGCIWGVFIWEGGSHKINMLGSQTHSTPGRRRKRLRKAIAVCGSRRLDLLQCWYTNHANRSTLCRGSKPQPVQSQPHQNEPSLMSNHSRPRCSLAGITNYLHPTVFDEDSFEVLTPASQGGWIRSQGIRR